MIFQRHLDNCSLLLAQYLTGGFHLSVPVCLVNFDVAWGHLKLT